MRAIPLPQRAGVAALRRSLLLALLLLGPGALGARGGEPDDRGLDLFEKKIRPVLVEHCYRCHSAEAEKNGKLRGGLKVDSRDGLLRGGDTGPALVPGKPDESPLVSALQYDDVVQMPPKGKLPDQVIADIRAWVEGGAPDPRVESGPGARSGIDLDAGRRHWAYQAPRDAPLPDVLSPDALLGPIDRFVLARLESAGLRPAPEADRATLARRLYFDLIGLPPTPEEVDAFLADDRPDAYERLVDRLLASPQFGERWGRHWLDVARFAESLTLRGFVFKEAWRYRDYVIDAFNADLPYDRFVREQLAGDLLHSNDLDERRGRLIATTFLTLGNTNLEEQDKDQLRMDVVDEQVDTIGKAFLAQTIGCARCHDHKFDPIPTRDYYALAGIFRNVKSMEHANVSKWLERPLPVPPDRADAIERHEKAVAELEGRIKSERARLAASGTVSGVGRTGVVGVGDLPGVVVDDAKARRVGEWKPSQYSGSYIGSGYLHDIDAGKGEKSLTFQPDTLDAGTYEIWLAYSAGGSRSAAVPVTILSADGESTVAVDMRPTPPIDGRFVSLGRHRFERNGQGYVLISNEGTKGHVTADAVAFIPIGRLDNGANRPGREPVASSLPAMEAELAKLKASGSAREMVMTVFEEDRIEDTRVHVRGSVHTLGEAAPRGFLRVIDFGEAPRLPGRQSGRKELADWIADARNPLPARVMANRVWHWLLGSGLVRTTDNFGTTGEAPSHPELLDWLALRFIEDGWSVKSLVRRIVLSRTYRLASADAPEARSADPENRLLSRANRRRLDAECLRDAMLAVAGRLRLDGGGPGFSPTLQADYGFRYAEPRRSVYVPVFRNALPELFEVFDFADPSTVVGRRDASTVAPQALFLMNHPFVLEQARAASRRLLPGPETEDASRLDRAYRLTLGRPPSAAESRLGLDFVSGSTATAEETWAAVFQALFATDEFRRLD